MSDVSTADAFFPRRRKIAALAGIIGQLGPGKLKKCVLCREEKIPADLIRGVCGKCRDAGNRGSA